MAQVLPEEPVVYQGVPILGNYLEKLRIYRDLGVLRAGERVHIEHHSGCLCNLGEPTCNCDAIFIRPSGERVEFMA